MFPHGERWALLPRDVPPIAGVLLLCDGIGLPVAFGG
jgi:hypothetical protein